MADNPYQAEAVEPILEARARRKPTAFQRTFSAVFLFLGSFLAVIAAATLLYDLSEAGAMTLFEAGRREAAVAAVLIGAGFVALGLWVRCSPRSGASIAGN